MKVMVNRDVITLHSKLEQALKVLSGRKVLYAIQRSLDMLSPIVKALQLTPTEGIKAYEQELMMAYKTLATDPSGKIKTITDNRGERYDIDYFSPEAVTARNDLEKKYSRELTAWHTAINEQNELLNQPLEEQLTLHYVPLSWLDENISGEHYSLIAPLVKALPSELEEKLNSLMEELAKIN